MWDLDLAWVRAQSPLEPSNVVITTEHFPRTSGGFLVQAPGVRRLLLLTVLGCSSTPSDDVTGPFTGEVHRFVVDGFTIPRDSASASTFAADLDGDDKPENQFGTITAVLATTNDLSLNAPDMIASGALASTVEIQADDLGTDPTVAVRYFGAEGDAVTLAGGELVDGAFRSNRTHATAVPGKIVLRLPIYTNADPLTVELEGVEIDLDPDGAGGFQATIRGGIREAHAREVAYAGLLQMFETEPERHIVFARGVDANRDGVLAPTELDESVIALLVTADIQLFDGTRYAPVPASTLEDSISFAFGVHLSACAAGRCTTAPPASTCRDRVRDGTETDVDCGGSCQPCAAALSCSVPADCQSAACDAGRCRAPSCSDAVRDGYESDVDCGGACGPCQVGQRCAGDADCSTGACDNGVATLGVCLAAA